METQREPSNIIEAKEEAARVRISNFYLTGQGTMQPQSFFCTKEPNTSRKIHTLETQQGVTTDPNEIIRIMQQHYEITATEKPVQTETLPEFLETLQITLPQLLDEQKESL